MISLKSAEGFPSTSDMQRQEIVNNSIIITSDQSQSSAEDNNNNDVEESHANMIETSIESELKIARLCDRDRNNPTLYQIISNEPDPGRTLDQLKDIAKAENFDPTSLSNEEIIRLMGFRHVGQYNLERILGKSNAKRCVQIRRQHFAIQSEKWDTVDNTSIKESHVTHNTINVAGDQPQSDHKSKTEALLYTQNTDFAYDMVVGACCENCIGNVRIPVGLAGPLRLDDCNYLVPLATTEGCLVASTSRGMSALTKAGGVTSVVLQDAMTRAPIVKFQDSHLNDALKNRNAAIAWLQDPANKEKIKEAFNSNSKHTRLIDYTLHPIGREMHIRFMAHTGDAMGMNMASKGAECALKELQKSFPSMKVITLSGNMCTDKKPSAINWVLGRGKSVECQAVIPADVVQQVLKVTVDDMIALHHDKVMIGSAMAGTIGGFNSHAANIIAAIYIATGQDVAHTVSSSNCMITLEKDSRGSLEVVCKMPSIECGTVGGGTHLPDQKNNLQILGLWGPTMLHESELNPQRQNVVGDSNACRFARVICATVMAAELSLLASLSQGTLVDSHMKLNRTTPCNVV